MKRMETDKVIVIEKTKYRSEDFISCSGVTRCIRNHGYKGGVVIVEDWNQNGIREEEPRTDGVSNTLTSVQKDNLLVEPVRIKANTKKGYEEVGEYGADTVLLSEKAWLRLPTQSSSRNI